MRRTSYMKRRKIMENDRCLIETARIEKCVPGARCDRCGWDRDVDRRLSRELRRRGLTKGKKGLFVLKTNIRGSK